MKKFDNYRKNLDVLRRSDQQDLNNEFIISGIIDKFSIQFELGWKVLKELLTYEGINAAKTGSPREIIKQAYQYYPCIEEDVWLDMLSQPTIWHIFTMEMPRKHWHRRLLAVLFRPLKSWKKAFASDTPIFWIRSEKLFYKHMEAHDGT